MDSNKIIRYICKECGEKFVYKYNYDVHLRMHILRQRIRRIHGKGEMIV